MSVDYSQPELVRSRSAVDRLLHYLGNAFRQEPVSAAVATGFVIGAITNSGIGFVVGGLAAYFFTSPLRRDQAPR